MKFDPLNQKCDAALAAHNMTLEDLTEPIHEAWDDMDAKFDQFEKLSETEPEDSPKLIELDEALFLADESVANSIHQLAADIQAAADKKVADDKAAQDKQTIDTQAQSQQAVNDKEAQAKKAADEAEKKRKDDEIPNFSPSRYLGL